MKKAGVCWKTTEKQRSSSGAPTQPPPRVVLVDVMLCVHRQTIVWPPVYGIYIYSFLCSARACGAGGKRGAGGGAAPRAFAVYLPGARAAPARGAAALGIYVES